MCKNPDTGRLDYDLLFIKVGDKKCPSFKNVINNFLSDDDIPEQRFRVSLRVKSGLIMTDAVSDVQTYSYEGMPFFLTDGFRYTADTRSGDCGTPVLMAQGKDITKCVGIHVAGTVSKDYPAGLACRISKEMILEAIGDDLPAPSNFVGEGPFIDRIEEMECPNLRSIEEMPQNAVVHLSDKTKIKPSILAEHLPWETVREPAILSSRDPRSGGKDPIEEALS